MNRYFFTLDLDKAIDKVSMSCHTWLLSNPSPKLWPHIRHQSLPPPLDPLLVLKSSSDGNNTSSPYVKLSHHLLSRLSMRVRKVMTSWMQLVHYVPMPGTWVTCAGYVLTPHLGWYLYCTMPLSNAWVTILKRGMRKVSTKTLSQRKGLRNLVWNFSMSEMTIVPDYRKPQLTHPPRWSFRQRDMDTKGSGRQALCSQNHLSDNHRASSDEEDSRLPTRPHTHMSLPIDMPVHTSQS